MGVQTGMKKMLKSVVWILVVFSLVSIVFVSVNFYFVFRRFETPKYSKFLEYEDVKDTYPRKEMSFYSGKNKLQGYLYGEENRKGIVVISHGVFSGARGYLAEALFFVNSGYQVFAFDYTGYCGSQGKSSVGLRQGVYDLEAALTFVGQEEVFCDGPLYLYGHSWGGYNVAAVLTYNHPIAGVVSLAGFNEPEEVIIDWAKKEIGSFAILEYPYVDLSQRLLFGENANATAVEAINTCEIPIMIVHGSEDDVVDFREVGIMAHRKEITNPNVLYVVRDEDKQNDHTNFYRSKEAVTYIKQLDEQYKQIKKREGRHWNEKKEREFYEKIDKEKTSRLDEAFMESVVTFYEQCAKESTSF